MNENKPDNETLHHLAESGQFPAGDDPAQRRQAIVDMENAMRQQPQRELQTFHHWSHGVYVRELHIPADTILTGHIHQYPCLNIVPVGDIEVATESGRKRIQGYAVFESPAGIKRAGYTFSDTIWMTVHGIPLDAQRDDAAMAELLTVPSFEQLEPDTHT